MLLFLFGFMEPEKKPSIYDDFSTFGSLGIELVVSVLIGAGVGYWLDKRLGTSPWLMVVGFIIGAAAGIRSAYQTIAKLDKK